MIYFHSAFMDSLWYLVQLVIEIPAVKCPAWLLVKGPTISVSWGINSPVFFVMLRDWRPKRPKRLRIQIWSFLVLNCLGSSHPLSLAVWFGTFSKKLVGDRSLGFLPDRINGKWLEWLCLKTIWQFSYPKVRVLYIRKYIYISYFLSSKLNNPGPLSLGRP